MRQNEREDDDVMANNIKVCDCIMGSGKTESAITYMNEHPENKYIYITPYLDEAKRIRMSCKKLKFVEPSNKLDEYGFSKTKHTAQLIKEGRNITTTHAAFKRYDDDTLNNIREKGYILIIDESVDVLEQYDIHPTDLDMLVKGGYLMRKGNMYGLTTKKYKGDLFRELFEFLKARDLVEVENDEGGIAFYWALPARLLTSFRQVFVLTYLFEGQQLCHFFKISKLPYTKIGVCRDEQGVYRFGRRGEYIPEYVGCLKDKIHILDKYKYNEVGASKCDMSMSWYNRCPEGVDRLKKNLRNYFGNMHRDISPERKLWGGCADSYGKLRSKGFFKSFLPFNAKATNMYRDRDCLAYVANIFMNVGEKLMYKSKGCEVDEDMYALSIMIQWIWRSAIRDGKDIDLYLPSSRMRGLLVDWIDKVSREYNERKEVMILNTEGGDIAV